ncbi:MAG TPA: histidine kinase [Thermoanaerobaculia bacterium]|nr:histidine kinase [Thermoanaerobaculia bacterium]
METLYSPESRAERLIAAGRIVLASSSLFGVWLDPTEPDRHAAVAYSLLVAYVAYAALLALRAWRARGPGRRERVVTHVVDLAFFSLFVYFTAGPASPFTTYFVFSMLCATLRWRWRGVLWTAAASIVAYLAIAFLAGSPWAHPAEDYRLVVRVIYLGVIAVLLGYLGAHEEHTRREISGLAGWPDLGPQRFDVALAALLAHASRVTGAPRVLLAWSEREEPWLYFASWENGELQWSREGLRSAEPLVADELAETSFLTAAEGDPSLVLVRGAAGFSHWRGAPLRGPLRARAGPGPLLGLRLRSDSFAGHLLFTGKRGASSDDLVLGEAVAAMVAARLESVYLARSLAEQTATEERIRLARDLHDGVLQSLTGFGLRLEAIRRLLLEAGSGGATRRVEELQQLLALEQRDLRFFIQELEPSKPTGAGQPPSLRGQIAGLAQRLELEWGLKVRLAIDGANGELPERLGRDIYHIVREAMVNAVRHGNASAVDAAIRVAGDGVAIVVADNGGGFPFAGRFSHADLVAQNLGPRTLRDRVTALAGALTLDSSPAGAKLEIRLPLREGP